MGDEYGKTMKTQKTTVPFQIVQKEEQEALKEIWKTRKSQGKPGNQKKRFSVAFSGGGSQTGSVDAGAAFNRRAAPRWPAAAFPLLCGF